MTFKRSFLKHACTIAAMALLGHATLAHAQSKYPDKPIHIIVPSSAGSTLDIIARQISDRLAQQLGQPIVVENKAGASGMLAYDQVSKAKPDGYTLGMIQAGFVSNHFLFKNGLLYRCAAASQERQDEGLRHHGQEPDSRLSQCAFGQ